VKGLIILGVHSVNPEEEGGRPEGDLITLLMKEEASGAGGDFSQDTWPNNLGVQVLKA
jgi:hypothetical protein